MRLKRVEESIRFSLGVYILGVIVGSVNGHSAETFPYGYEETSQNMRFEYRIENNQNVYEGPVKTYIIDKMQSENHSEFVSYILADQTQHKWVKVEDPSHMLSNVSFGERMRLTGNRLNNSFQINAVKSLADRNSLALTLNSQDTVLQSVATVLINFTGSFNRQSHMSRAEAEDHLTRTNAVFGQGTWKRVQFNTDLNGDGESDIFEVTIPFNGGCSDPHIFRTFGGDNSWESRAREALGQQGIDSQRYQHLMMVSPIMNSVCNLQGTRGIALVGDVGLSTSLPSVILEEFAPAGHSTVVPHELGHNLGLTHASDNSGDSFIEYGDGSSIMGNFARTLPLNPANAKYLKGFEAYPEKFIQADWGIFTLSTLGEHPFLAHHPNVIQVPIGNTGRNYYISVRHEKNLDENIQDRFKGKVSIHLDASPSQGGQRRSILRDILNVGDRFAENDFGISIEVVDLNTQDQTARVKIVGTDAPNQPLVGVNEAPQANAQTVYVINHQESFFALAFNDPSGPRGAGYQFHYPPQTVRGNISGTDIHLGYFPKSTEFVGEDNFTWHMTDGEFDSDKVSLRVLVLPDGEMPSTLLRAELDAKNIQSDGQVTFELDVMNNEKVQSCTLDFGNGITKPCGSTITHQYTHAVEQACAHLKDIEGNMTLACHTFTDLDQILGSKVASLPNADPSVQGRIGCASGSPLHLVLLLLLAIVGMLPFRELRERV